MSDDSRMYTRQTGDTSRRSSSSSSAKTGPSTDAAGAGSSSSFNTSLKSDFAVSQQVYEKYHDQMGVSPFTLRAMFRRVDLSALTSLEKHVTAAQMARVGSFGTTKSRAFEERLKRSSVSNLDAKLLEFALQMKPVEILSDILDEHQNNADVRTLFHCVAEDSIENGSDLPDDPRLLEALNAYQEVVDADVALMTGTGHGDKHSQVHEVALLAQDCYAKFDAIINEPPVSPEVPNEAAPLTVDSIRARKEKAKSAHRITSETMKSYKVNSGRLD